MLLYLMIIEIKVNVKEMILK